MAPFDLVVLLILSETVQNAMVGEDKSLLGGLISGTLIALAQLLNYVSWRSKRIDRWVQGTPKILVWHGHRQADVMAQERVTMSELAEAMRRQGCSNITDVRIAMLENDGKISIIKREGM